MTHSDDQKNKKVNIGPFFITFLVIITIITLTILMNRKEQNTVKTKAAEQPAKRFVQFLRQTVSIDGKKVVWRTCPTNEKGILLWQSCSEWILKDLLEVPKLPQDEVKKGFIAYGAEVYSLEKTPEKNSYVLYQALLEKPNPQVSQKLWIRECSGNISNGISWQSCSDVNEGWIAFPVPNDNATKDERYAGYNIFSYWEKGKQKIVEAYLTVDGKRILRVVYDLEPGQRFALVKIVSPQKYSIQQVPVINSKDQNGKEYYFDAYSSIESYVHEEDGRQILTQGFVNKENTAPGNLPNGAMFLTKSTIVDYNKGIDWDMFNKQEWQMNDMTEKFPAELVTEYGIQRPVFYGAWTAPIEIKGPIMPSADLLLSEF